MAARKRDDFCLVCMESPCECKKAGVAKVARRPVLPKVEPVRQPKLPAHDPVSRPTRAGLGAVKRLPPKVTPPAGPKPTRLPPPKVDPADEAMDQAITIIAEAGLLGEDEIRKHRKSIKLSDTRIRAILWTQRREARERATDKTG